MPPESPDRAARAAARATWPIRRFRLGEEPPDDLATATTPAQRVAMMWPLAEAAWSVAGRVMPRYPRKDTPARLFPPGAPRPPDE